MDYHQSRPWTREELEVIQGAVSRGLSTKETHELLGNTRTASSVSSKMWETKKGILPTSNIMKMKTSNPPDFNVQNSNVQEQTDTQTFKGVLSAIEDAVYSYLETLIDTLENEREDNAQLREENAKLKEDSAKLQELVNNRSFSSKADELMRKFIRK